MALEPTPNFSKNIISVFQVRHQTFSDLIKYNVIIGAAKAFKKYYISILGSISNLIKENIM